MVDGSPLNFLFFSQSSPFIYSSLISSIFIFFAKVWGGGGAGHMHFLATHCMLALYFINSRLFRLCFPYILFLSEISQISRICLKKLVDYARFMKPT